ncbi:MAG: hypothetical protein R2713_07030 [Ilumatobacteraceae bacterium]
MRRPERCTSGAGSGWWASSAVGRKFNRWLDVALMQCLLHERQRPTTG